MSRLVLARPARRLQIWRAKMNAEELTAGDQETRIRAALGLRSGPLPEVQSKWLDRYYEYLAGNLALPFDAEFAEDIAGHRLMVSGITVTAILPPDGQTRSEQLGLLCRAVRGTQELELPLTDVELREGARNQRLVEDYWYWFWNWRFDPRI
jgi:hypothetical protein